MADAIVTNNDLSSLVLDSAKFKDEQLTFGGAGTVLDGTILSRKQVDDAVVSTPDGGNTGDGTNTVVSVIAGDVIPLVGNYNLEVVEAVVNGGVFKLVDPNGVLVEGRLEMEVGAGAATIFSAGGLTFTLTDGATDFIVGDKFALAVVSNGKMVPFVIGGVGGAGVPTALVNYDVVAAGAGDEAIRALISGEVREGKIIIDADGDGSNVTAAILDQLRDFTIVASPVAEQNIVDNQ